MSRALVLAARAAIVLSLAGCTSESSSPQPLGHGDDFFGLDATDMPTGNGDDAGAFDAAIFAPVDGGYGVLPDAYAPLALCSQCGCEGGTYCFGGSPGASFSGSCDQTQSSGLEIGCHSLPAGCADASDCVCLLGTLASQTSCYPACAGTVTSGFSVYCAP